MGERAASQHRPDGSGDVIHTEFGEDPGRSRRKWAAGAAAGGGLAGLTWLLARRRKKGRSARTRKSVMAAVESGKRAFKDGKWKKPAVGMVGALYLLRRRKQARRRVDRAFSGNL